MRLSFVSSKLFWILVLPIFCFTSSEWGTSLFAFCTERRFLQSDAQRANANCQLVSFDGNFAGFVYVAGAG